MGGTLVFAQRILAKVFYHCHVVRSGYCFLLFDKLCWKVHMHFYFSSHSNLNEF